MLAVKPSAKFASAVAVLALAVATSATAVAPDELLEPEKAFRITARALDERSAEVEFRIAEGYYMYRNRFALATESGRPLADVEIPRGEEKEDEFFGKTETFRDLVRIRVPLAPGDLKAGGVNLKVTSQGCADVGVCYTPLEQVVRVSLPGTASGASRGSALSRPAVPAVPWASLAAALAAGLALAWASTGAPPPGPQAPRVTLAPGAGLIGGVLALAVAGALSAWLGSLAGGRSNPWIAGPVALAYVVCAAYWLLRAQRRGESSASRLQWPNIVLLAAVMLFAFHAADAWLGAAAAFGAGLVYALAPVERPGLPREPALQGVALAHLAAAVWVAGPVLPEVLRMLAWSASLFAAAALLRAIDPLPRPAPGVLRVAKAVGVAALVWAIAVLIGAAGGARDPLQPFAPWRAAPPADVSGSGR